MTAARPRRRLDRFELAVLAAFAAMSVWVLSLDLWQVVVNGRVWTGTDGFYIVDQMQYLAWIRSSSQHLLSANLFVLHGTPADYFQPAILLSGGLAALGVVPWLALLLWKPVAVLAMFFAVRAYAQRAVTGLWARRVVLVLALFFGSFTVVYGSFSVVGDLFPGFLAWGYTFGLLALACVPAALVTYERARASRRLSLIPGLLGALASSLHPWQGELLILIVIGTELGMFALHRRRPRPPLTLPLVTVAMTLPPLLYLVVLGHFDQSWQLAREASKHTFTLWTILLAIAPLGLPAIFAYRRRPVTFIDLATRVWPIAALVVYVSSASDVSATPLHAFDGITIPLGVLAVEAVRRSGWARMRHRAVVAAAAVAAVTVPTTVFVLDNATTIVAPTAGNPNFIARDEQRALDFLARDPAPGGVLTRFYLGTIVPEYTGRRTYVGHCLWSQPHCGPRARIAQRLLDGALPPRAAQRFVRRVRPRFVLSDCEEPTDLTTILGPLVARVDRFGCARIYELKPSVYDPKPHV